MAELIITIDFPDVSEKDLKACYDQIDEIQKATVRALNRVPLGKYAGLVTREVC